MNIHEFIKETVSSIAEATIELRSEYEARGVVINPPSYANADQLFTSGDSLCVSRRVQNITFDIAVSTGEETGVKGEAKLRVIPFEFGGGGSQSNSTSSVSRVQFSIPIALPPSQEEEKNKEAKRLKQQKFTGPL